MMGGGKLIKSRGLVGPLCVGHRGYRAAAAAHRIAGFGTRLEEVNCRPIPHQIVCGASRREKFRHSTSDRVVHIYWLDWQFMYQGYVIETGTRIDGLCFGLCVSFGDAMRM